LIQITSVTDRQTDRRLDNGQDAQSILLSRVKKIMGGYETGGGLEQNWGACAPPGPGLKPPLSVARQKCHKRNFL